MRSVYTFGPTFRAEYSHTTRHLAYARPSLFSGLFFIPPYFEFGILNFESLSPPSPHGPLSVSPVLLLAICHVG